VQINKYVAFCLFYARICIDYYMPAYVIAYNNIIIIKNNG